MADSSKTPAFAAVKTFVDNGESHDKQEFDITQCRVETVVVYLDRAEVCRVVKTKLETGENEVKLKNLSQCIDKDSVRYCIKHCYDCRFASWLLTAHVDV